MLRLGNTPALLVAALIAGAMGPAYPDDFGGVDPEGLNFQNRKGKIVPYQAKQLGKKIKEYLAKRDEQSGKE